MKKELLIQLAGAAVLLIIAVELILWHSFNY